MANDPDEAPHYYILREDRQEGPFDLEAINEMLRHDEVHPHDLAWRPGMAEWKPLSSIPGLSLTAPLSPQTQARIDVSQIRDARSRRIGSLGFLILALIGAAAVAVLAIWIVPKLLKH